MNIIPYAPPSDPLTANYKDSHFPRERPPVPVAPYVGGVEWEATNYLASHLDLLNGIIASLPLSQERNQLRQELKDSGLEKCLGGSLRTCKEKFYGSVHIGLTTWVAAAKEDGWDVAFVREGPKREEIVRVSPKKQKKKDSVPKLEMPLLELTGGGGGGNESGKGDGGWL